MAPHTAPPQPILVTVPEAAAALRVNRSTIYALVTAGELTLLHLGRASRIRTAELVAYVDRLARST